MEILCSEVDNGICLFTLTAKSISSRGGKLVILNPPPEVLSVLEIKRIPAIIPVYSNLGSAETILMI